MAKNTKKPVKKPQTKAKKKISRVSMTETNVKRLSLGELRNLMSIKQRGFVDALIENGGKKEEAARAGGYAASTAPRAAWENLNKPHVAEYLRRVQEKAASKQVSHVEYVMSSLKKLTDEAMEATSASHRKNALKGLELIGKTQKMFTERHEHTAEGISFNLNFTSDPQQTTPPEQNEEDAD